MKERYAYAEMMIRNSPDTETLELSLTEVKDEKWHEIILFNDDVNTFDWVIASLMEVCDHTPEQAEQCSILVHYKGKCGVKSGSYKKLKPMCSELLNRGLSAEIAG